MKHLVLSFFLFAGLMKAQAPSSCQHAKQAPVFPSVFTAPENLRSDTADILKYTVSLNITDFTTNVISGNTVVRFSPKINGLNYLCLDLLEMTIDSIRHNGNALTYSYNDTLLRIDLPGAFNTSDTLDISVYYRGVPVMDASGWGGWYFSSGYAFNLGVGFAADPHVYGRVWHPCFDNFSERAKYEFRISTNNGKLAYCNGALVQDSTDVNGLRTRTWMMNEEIPTYLASISVAAYTHVNKIYPVMMGNIPVMLTALPGDTTNLKNSFVHLPDALAGFENFYGPYVWNRIGFCLVPFSSGAMEHATNISYPKSAANGSLAYEELMAHEFAHHWWGDLVTCETAGDMWINEGMASYSEYLFRNWYYGYTSYIDGIKTNHEEMVHHVHRREGWRAVSGVPHEYVYGDHVYRKGADMAHTMRTYLGDSLFRVGLNFVQQQKAFKNMNTVEFGNLLTAATGINLNQFMTDWLLNPGWPHFSIDSVRSVNAGGGNFNVTVFVRQRLFGAPNYFTNVPLEITFRNPQWQDEVKTILVSGPLSSFNFMLSYDPVFTGINLGSKISDAISSKYKTITATGVNSFAPANLSLNIQNAGADSSWIRVEHNFIRPDSVKFNTGNYRLNDQHYWKIDGILSPGFHSKATFYYDGRKITSGVTQYLDTLLTAVTADSLILLYRRNTADDWKEVDKYTKTKIGGVTSKYGYFVVDTVRLGEYAAANGISAVLPGIKEIGEKKDLVSVFPNPAKNTVTIEIKNYDPSGRFQFELLDAAGKRVKDEKISGGVVQVSLGNLPSGNYIVHIFSGPKQISSHKLLISKD